VLSLSIKDNNHVLSPNAKDNNHAMSVGAEDISHALLVSIKDIEDNNHAMSVGVEDISHALLVSVKDIEDNNHMMSNCLWVSRTITMQCKWTRTRTLIICYQWMWRTLSMTTYAISGVLKTWTICCQWKDQATREKHG